MAGPSAEQPFSAPYVRSALSGGAALHVWHFSLALPTSARLTEGLDADECARAGRFRDPVAAARFAAGRQGLRRVLGRYLACAPAAVPLAARAADGKPVLADAAAGSGLHFSLSRSGARALVVVTRGGEVGADLECLSPASVAVEPVEVACTDAEAAWLARRAQADRPRAFLRLWTVKEAVLKAWGVGLRLDPRRLDVLAALEGPQDDVAIPCPDGDRPPAWVCAVDGVPDAVAAVAALFRPVASRACAGAWPPVGEDSAATDRTAADALHEKL